MFDQGGENLVDGEDLVCILWIALGQNAEKSPGEEEKTTCM